MAARKTKAPGKPGPRASRSGPNIPETQRATEAIKLRLPPATAALLRDLAEEYDVSVSGLVDACVHAAHNSGTLKALLQIARMASELRGR